MRGLVCIAVLWASLAAAQDDPVYVLGVPAFATTSTTFVNVPGASVSNLFTGVVFVEGELWSDLAEDVTSRLEIFDPTNGDVMLRVGCHVANTPQPFFGTIQTFDFAARLVAAPGARVAVDRLTFTLMPLMAASGTQDLVTATRTGTSYTSALSTNSFLSGQWLGFASASMHSVVDGGAVGARQVISVGPTVSPAPVADGGARDFFLNPTRTWFNFTSAGVTPSNAMGTVRLEVHPGLGGGTTAEVGPKWVLALRAAENGARWAFQGPAQSVSGAGATTVAELDGGLNPGLTYIAVQGLYLRAPQNGPVGAELAVTSGVVRHVATFATRRPAGAQLPIAHAHAFTATGASSFSVSTRMVSPEGGLVEAWGGHALLFGPWDGGLIFLDGGPGLDGGVPRPDAGFRVDAGATDAGSTDAGAVDAGATDAGAVDAGATADAGPTDAGTSTDAGSIDGPPRELGAGCACSTADASWLLLLAAAVLRARRRAA